MAQRSHVTYVAPSLLLQVHIYVSSDEDSGSDVDVDSEFAPDKFGSGEVEERRSVGVTRCPALRSLTQVVASSC